MHLRLSKGPPVSVLNRENKSSAKKSLEKLRAVRKLFRSCQEIRTKSLVL